MLVCCCYDNELNYYIILKYLGVFLYSFFFISKKLIYCAYYYYYYNYYYFNSYIIIELFSTSKSINPVFDIYY